MQEFSTVPHRWHLPVRADAVVDRMAGLVQGVPEALPVLELNRWVHPLFERERVVEPAEVDFKVAYVPGYASRSINGERVSAAY